MFRTSDIQAKKFRCPIPIPMSVMLNYAGEAGDGRRQLMIVSRLDGRPRVVIWMRVGVDNNRLPAAAHLRLRRATRQTIENGPVRCSKFREKIPRSNADIQLFTIWRWSDISRIMSQTMLGISRLDQSISRIRPVKNGEWWRWALASPDGVAPSQRSVCLPLLIFPCTIKSRSSLLAPAHPGGPGKWAVKRLCVWRCV